MLRDSQSELEELGRFWFRQALTEPELRDLERASRTAGRPGLRLNWSEAFERALGSKSEMSELVESLLPNARPVRLVAFDKTPNANWAVPWHQDRVLAVASRHELNRYSNWARKAGVWHVEPPIEILSQMVFARIHFDDADASNGCLELALGTHKFGLIPSAQATNVAKAAKIESCVAKRGDVLFVSALTLHRSATSQSVQNRRALRVDYANFELPPPLDWALRLDT